MVLNIYINLYIYIHWYSARIPRLNLLYARVCYCQTLSIKNSNIKEAWRSYILVCYIYCLPTIIRSCLELKAMET
jgi:hypothetical protein